MPKEIETHILPFTTQQLYDLVIDIEKYPEFLPWVGAARVRERFDDGSLKGDLVAHFKGVRERFTSHVKVQPPEGDHAECRIDVDLLEGPFHYLENHWHFIPDGKNQTKVEFAINFQFKSKILESLMGFMFHRALAKMVAGFEARAHVLYNT